MQTTEEILKLAQKNQQQARQVIEETGVVGCWQSINARINLIGSLKTGLLMKHRDIDFHMSTPKLDIAESFRAVALLAGHTGVIAVEYANLSDEEDACLEWHAKYRDKNGDCWQIDMIHMADGSRWDGYFEKIAERIGAVMSPKQKETILRLKFATPDDVKIAGIEYYMAVLRDRIEDYEQFLQWRQTHQQTGIVDWIP